MRRVPPEREAELACGCVSRYRRVLAAAIALNVVLAAAAAAAAVMRSTPLAAACAALAMLTWRASRRARQHLANVQAARAAAARIGGRR